MGINKKNTLITLLISALRLLPSLPLPIHGGREFMFYGSSAHTAPALQPSKFINRFTIISSKIANLHKHASSTHSSFWENFPFLSEFGSKVEETPMKQTNVHDRCFTFLFKFIFCLLAQIRVACTFQTQSKRTAHKCKHETKNMFPIFAQCPSLHRKQVRCWLITFLAVS